MQHTAILKNWIEAPLSSGLVFIGEIYGDVKKKFKDGDQIRTSLVVDKHEEKDENGFVRHYVQTLNSVYLLEGEEMKNV